jgi:hypothetical protein
MFHRLCNLCSVKYPAMELTFKFAKILWWYLNGDACSELPLLSRILRWGVHGIW